MTLAGVPIRIARLLTGCALVSAVACGGDGGSPAALPSSPAIHTTGPQANECRPARAASLTVEGDIAGRVSRFCNGNDQYRVNVGREDGKPVMAIVAAYAFAVSGDRYEMVVSATSRSRTRLPLTARLRATAAEGEATSGGVILYQPASPQGLWKSQSGTITFGTSGIELDVRVRNGEMVAHLVGGWKAEPDIERQ